MMKLFTPLIILFFCFSIQAQNFIVDQQSQSVEKSDWTNTAVAIGSTGMLTLTRTDKKEWEFMAYAGANLGDGQFETVTPSKKLEPFGTLSAEDHGYIYMVTNRSYLRIDAGSDFAVQIMTDKFPKGFKPIGLKTLGNKGLFYSSKALVLHDPISQINDEIPIVPEVIKSSVRILKVDTFEDSNEVIIYLGLPGKITHLIRYTIGENKTTLLTIPSNNLGYYCEGSAVIDGSKTYFGGSTGKSNFIQGLVFIAFEGSTVSNNSNLPLDSLSYNKFFRRKSDLETIYEKQEFKKTRPMESVTYTPIILENGNVVVLQELYRNSFYVRHHISQKNSVTGMYENADTKIFTGYEAYTSLVTKYTPQGELVWDSYFNNFANYSVNLKMEAISDVTILAPNIIQVVQPSYEDVKVCIIDAAKESLTSKQIIIEPVDAESYPRVSKDTYRTNSKRILPLLGDKYLYYGYNIVAPLLEDKKVVERASYQLLQMDFIL